jgi:hypothetical protein
MRRRGGGIKDTGPGAHRETWRAALPQFPQAIFYLSIVKILYTVMTTMSRPKSCLILTLGT